MSRRSSCRLEFAKSVLAASVLLAAMPAPTASADVQGERVIRGDVTFHRQGNRLLIRAGDGSIIEYARFDIGRNQVVRFIQPGELSRVLNRIDGAAPSRIEGRLLANGQVYLVNPAGVIFGANSVVNVGGLYAAAAQISNTNFLAGLNQFTDASGSIINQGTLRGDAVHLLGRHVENYGHIRTDGGIVTMLAGDNMLIGEVGGRVLVQVDGRTLAENAAPSHGGTAPSLSATPGVRNEGSVSAGGGRIALGAGDLYALGIHNAGKLRAPGGRIDVSAKDGLVRNTGTMTTSVVNGQAGAIDVNGPSILNEGRITADAWSGAAGDIRFTSQNHTYLLPHSRISAAGGPGFAQGGRVIVHSFDGFTGFARRAVINVSGGALGGAGGFAEVSGFGLDFMGSVRLQSREGFEAGTLLIDPLNIRITNAGTENGAGFFGDGQILFNEGAANATLRIRPNSLRNFGGAIILQATNDITVENDVNLNLNNNAITLEAGNNVTFNNNVRIDNATQMTIVADQAFTGFPSDGVGNVIILGGGAFAVSGPVNITGVNIQIAPTSFTSTSSITLNGAVSFTNAGNQVMTAGSFITINGAVAKATGDLSFTAAADLTVTGNLNVSSGVLSAAGTALNFGGNVSTSGALTFNDPVNAAGDIASAAALTFNDPLTLTGAGTQTLSAGTTLTTNAGATIDKAAGDLVVTGTTGVSLGDAVTIASGDFSSTGGTFANTGAPIEAVNIDIDHTGDVNVAADLLADDTLRVRAGNDGTGNLTVGAVTLEAIDMLFQAGNGAGGGAASTVSFNAAAVFQGPTPGSLDSFLWQQDAAILNSTGPNPGQFTDGLAGLDYIIISDDGGVTIDSLLRVAGTDLVLSAATDVNINVALNLASLDATAGNAINLNGAFLTTSGSQRYRSPVVLGLTLPLQSTGGGDLIFDSTVTGTLFDLTLNTTGTTRFSALTDVNLLTFAGAGGAIELAAGAHLRTIGAQVYGKPIVLLGNAQITGVAAANLTFQQAISGAFDLTINPAATSSGNVTFNGALSGLQNLLINTSGVTRFNGLVTVGTLEVDAPGTTEVNVATITTTGFQRWNDPLTLLTNATFASVAGNITFFNTVTGGAFDLVVDTGGLTRFDNNVTVRSISTIGGGNTRFSGPLTVLTSAGQSFSDAVVLFGDTIFQDTGSANILFSNGASGLFVLDARTGGVTRLAGTVTIGRLVTDAGGTTELNTSITTNAGQSYGDDVVLGANVTLTDNGASLIRFADSVTGAFNLAVNTAGVTRFEDLVSIAALTTDAAGTTELNNGGVSTTGNQTYNDAVVLGQNTVLASSGNGAIRLIGGANGAFDLTINTGGISEIRGATSVGSITTDAVGTTQLRGGIIAANGMTFNDAVTLTTNTTLDTTNSAILFGSTLSGGFDLTTSTGSGNVTFQGQVNGLDDVVINNTGVTTFAAAASMNSLTTNAGGATQINGGSITTTTFQRYQDDVTFGGATTLTAGTDVRFDQALTNATIDLIINAAGETRFDGAVTLQSLATDAAGTTRINGGSVATTGSQTYNDQIVLGAATTLASTGAGGVLLRGGATGAFALNLNTVGSTELRGPVNVASIATDAGGTTELRGAITTSGNQTYNDAVTLGANTTLDTGGGDLTFADSLGGAFNLIATTTGGAASFQAINGIGNLTVNAGAGNVAFQGVITGAGDMVVNSSGATTFAAAATMNSLTTDAGGTTLLNGGSITTTGDQTYNDAVTLGANTTLATGGGNLAFNDSLGGAFNLTANTSGGNASFQGIAGLIDLLVNAGAGNVNLAGAVNGLNSIVINSAGVTTIGAPITNTGSLTTDAAGSTLLSGGTITTTGAQSFGDAVTLGANTTLTTTNSNILFADALSGGFNLTIANGAGSTTFQGLVSGLGDLVVNSSGITRFQSAASMNTLTTNVGGSTRINGGAITTVGTQTYGDAVVLGANTVLTTNNSAILFGSTLGGPFNLTTNTGAGNVVFQGVVTGLGDVVINNTGVTTFAAAASMNTLTTNAGGATQINGGSVTTTGNQTYNDAVTIGANTTLTTGGGNLTFANTLLGGFNVTANTGGGNATFQNLSGLALVQVDAAGGAIGFLGTINGATGITANTSGVTTFGSTVDNVGFLTTDAGGSTQINGGSITTIGAQTYGDAVLLGANTTLTTTNSNILFSNTLGGAFDLTTSTGSGNVTFQGQVNGLDDVVINNTGVTTFAAAASMNSLTTNAGGATQINGGSVTTTGAQSYGDQVTLGANTTLSTGGGNLTFGDLLTGGFDLTVNAGAGNVAFLAINGLNDLVVNSTGTTTFGGAAALNSLRTNAGGVTQINGGSIITTGAQVYNDAVALGANTILGTTDSAVLFGSTLGGAFDLAVNAGAGHVTFQGVINGLDDVTVNSTGTTTFAAAASMGSLTTNAGGVTRLNGGAVATTGGQTYGDQVILGANTSLTTNNAAMLFNDGVTGGGNSLAISTGLGDVTFLGASDGLNTVNVASAGATTFGGVATIGTLVTDAAGTTNLGGVLNINTLMGIGDAILLVGASTINYTGASPLIFGTTIDDDPAPAGHSLRINSSSDIIFQQAIGGINPLGSFAAQTTGGPPFRAIIFNTNLVRTTGDLALQPDGHASVPSGPTIIAHHPDGILFHVVGNGDFIMGQNAKLVVADPTLGIGAIIDTATQSVLRVQLDGTGTATLGDISSLGDMNVTAQTIRIRLRDPGFLIAGPTIDDLTLELDFGTDFVTGGVFRFSSNPVVFGAGRGGLFANPDGQGDVTGNLSGFIIQAFGINQNVVDAMLLRLANGDVALVDLRTDGPTITNYAQALASVIPRDEKAEAVDPESALDATEIELLNQLGVTARFLPVPDARQNAEEGVGRFNDRRARLPELPSVTANRLQTQAARGLLDQYRSLEAGGSAQVAAASFKESVREQLREAKMLFLEQHEEFSPDGFLTFLSQEQFADAHRFIQGFRGIINGIRTLGLTNYEIQRTQEKLVNEFQPENITVAEMSELLGWQATQPEQPE